MSCYDSGPGSFITLLDSGSNSVSTTSPRLILNNDSGSMQEQQQDENMISEREKLLSLAVNNMDLRGVQEALQDGVNLSKALRNGHRTALHEACAVLCDEEEKRVNEDSNTNTNTGFNKRCSKTRNPRRLKNAELVVLEIVRVLLRAGASMVAEDEDGNTPLHEACYWGNLAIVQELTKHPFGGFLNQTNINGDTAFDVAVCQQRTAVVDYFLECLLGNSLVALHGSYSLHFLATNADIYIDVDYNLKTLLPFGHFDEAQMDSFLQSLVSKLPADSFCRLDDKGDLPLHIACRDTPVSVLICFLSSYMPLALSIPDRNGSLPLHLFCSAKQQEFRVNAVQMLVQCNVWSLATRDSNGLLPLHCALVHGADLPLVCYLVEKFTNSIRVPTGDGDLPLHLACRNNATAEMIQYLVQQYSIALNVPNFNDRSLPLHLACRYGASLSTIRFLVDCCPESIRKREMNGKTPVHICCENVNDIEMIRFLVEVGGFECLSECDNNGALPLHCLCQSQQPSLQSLFFIIHQYPEALSHRTKSGALPITLAIASAASQEIIYTLVRAHPVPEVLSILSQYLRT